MKGKRPQQTLRVSAHGPVITYGVMRNCFQLRRCLLSALEWPGSPIHDECGRPRHDVAQELPAARALPQNTYKPAVPRCSTSPIHNALSFFHNNHTNHTKSNTSTHSINMSDPLRKDTHTKLVRNPTYSHDCPCPPMFSMFTDFVFRARKCSPTLQSPPAPSSERPSPTLATSSLGIFLSPFLRKQ
jgi:hypothetical protein